MNSYRVKETTDSVFYFVDADLYWVDDNNNLNFYNLSEDGDEIAVATFRPWVSVVMMDAVESNEQQT